MDTSCFTLVADSSKRIATLVGYILHWVRSNTPANDQEESKPPIQTVLAGSLTQTAAITACAETASSSTGYWHFQIWYSTLQDSWFCRSYYQGTPAAQSDSSYFNIPDPDAGPVFGYQHT